MSKLPLYLSDAVIEALRAIEAKPPAQRSEEERKALAYAAAWDIRPPARIPSGNRRSYESPTR